MTTETITHLTSILRMHVWQRYTPFCNDRLSLHLLGTLCGLNAHMPAKHTNESAIQVAPADDNTVTELTRIGQDLLGVESISPDQNYFDLGGDSILAVQLFAQIEKVFQIKLPVATLFEAPTIEALARSEERRVGKECRYGGAGYQEKKKREMKAEDDTIK